MAILLVVVLTLLLPPIAGVLLGSVTTSSNPADISFSLDSIAYAYGQAKHYESLWNTLVFSAITASLVLLLGGFLAWLVERTDSPLRNITGLIALAPILVPSVLFVTGWILILSPSSGMINLIAKQYFGIEQPIVDIYSFPGMIWVGTLQELPLAFLWLRPAFRAMNPDLEEAALVAGASAFRVMRRITIPLLRPAFLSAWIIFFILSLGALIVPLLIGIPSKIFMYSVEIYFAANRFPTDLNLANAFGLTFLVASFVGVFAYRRATREISRFVTVTGKGFKPRITRLGPAKWPVTIVCATILILGMGLPVFVFVWNAFMPFPQAPSVESLKFFTFRNFAAALNYGPAVRALTNSLMLGVLAGVVTTALGGLIAWSTLREPGPKWLRGLLDQLATLPVAMPGLIVGVSLMWTFLFLPIPLYGTIWVLLIAYVILFLPYAVRICSSGISQLHQELEEAAYVSGASWPLVFRRIVLAIVAPSLFSAILYVGLRAFREYSASIFLVTPGSEVFSVLVLDMWDGGNFGILSAYVTMVTILLGLILMIASLLSRRFGVMAAD
jgi:iron(III) transport system permease protein